MKTQAVYLYIFFLLATSVASALTCEKHFGLRVSKQLGISYEADLSYTLNEALAFRVLAAAKRRDYGPESVWYEFMKDPRYAGPKIPADSVEMIAKSVERSEGTPVNLQYYEYTKEIRAKNPGALGLEPARTFVTWEGVGIRFLNLLFSERTGVVGVMEDFVDGRHMTRKEFVEHDIAHGHALELATSNGLETPWGKDTFSARHFESFRYRNIIERLSEHERVLFDLGHYLSFHEGISANVFGITISMLGSHPSLEAVQKAYDSLSVFRFSFDFRNGLSVHLSKREYTNDDQSSLIFRLLNDRDMRNLLPISIRKKISGLSREDAKKVVGVFLTEALTLFYRQHYRVTLQLLGLTDPKL